MGIDISCAAYGFGGLAAVVVNPTGYDDIVVDADLVVGGSPFLVAEIKNAVCGEYSYILAAFILDCE